VISCPFIKGNRGNYFYNFTTVQSYLDGQKELSAGVFGMISDDYDANGIINNLDKTQWNSKAGKSGYLNSDNDLNGQSDNVDKNDLWDINFGAETKVP
jgi:hypothetical protein